ncbi:hypothetical protein Tco_0020279 [Tanacetum coccineum]
MMQTRIMSPSEHPKEKYNLDTATKLARAKPNKRSGDADLSKDKSGPESPLEFQRSWYVEGHIRSGVISSVLMQRCQRTIKQRYSPCEGPLSLEGHEIIGLLLRHNIPIYPKEGGMVDSQPIEEEFQGAATKDENTDVLRTMIKEHDQQAKMKATPRKLAYADSDKEAPAGSLAKGFSDRFSIESSGTSDTRRAQLGKRQEEKGPSPGERGPNIKRRVQTPIMTKLKKQIEEAVASGKLAHLVKDIRQNNQRNGSPGRNDVKVINMIRGNISSLRSNRSSSNFGKERKNQDGANGVCNNKMSFVVQHHNRKDRNEKPQSNVLSIHTISNSPFTRNRNNGKQ